MSFSGMEEIADIIDIKRTPFLTGLGLLYKMWPPKWFFQTTSFISF